MMFMANWREKMPTSIRIDTRGRKDELKFQGSIYIYIDHNSIYSMYILYVFSLYLFIWVTYGNIPLRAQRGRIHRRKVCAVVCWCFLQIRVPKRMFSIPTNMELKERQHEPMNFQRHYWGTGSQKVSKLGAQQGSAVPALEHLFDPNS